MTWTAVEGATSYIVYRGGISIGTPTTNAYSDTGRTPSTAYVYEVSAVNSIGESAKSASINVTTLA